MVAKQCKVVWTTRSQQQLKKAFDYICKDSTKNALQVINDLVDAVENSASNPERHAADKYKKDNDGSYRAFEKHHYRVSYRYHNNVIRVLRVRHTNMEPRVY